MKKAIISILCLIFLCSMISALAVFGYEVPEPTEEELSIIETHSLGLTGVSNARQLGGYVTEDGRKVKENVLIRSGALAGATEDDLKILSEDYNVKLIIDLRSESDFASEPDPAFNDAQVINIPVLDESLMAVSWEDYTALLQEFFQTMRADLKPRIDWKKRRREKLAELAARQDAGENA